jgi:hypothetical protein
MEAQRTSVQRADTNALAGFVGPPSEPGHNAIASTEDTPLKYLSMDAVSHIDTRRPCGISKQS